MPGPRKQSLANGTYAATPLGDWQPRKSGGFDRATACRLTPHRFLQGEATRVCSVCGFTEPLEPLSFMERTAAKASVKAPPPVLEQYQCSLCGKQRMWSEMATRHERRGVCRGCAEAVKRAAEERR